MSTLSDLAAALATGAIEVVDLTAPLSRDDPGAPAAAEPFGQTARFELEEISRYDDRGPAWYWNNFRTGEHTGTHFDAPNHWVTGQGQGRRGLGPGPAADRPGSRARLLGTRPPQDPDFLLEVDHIKGWEAENGPLPEGGWLLVRTGWDARSTSQDAFLNADENGPHTPGMSVRSARGGWPRSPR